MKKTISIFALLLVATTSFAQGYRVNRTEEKKKVKINNTDFGKNIISFTPAQIMALDLYNDAPDVCVGISYERVMDNEILSIRLPFYSSLKNNFYYFMPQLKFYPKKQGIVRYAVGPQFLFGVGDVEYTRYVQGSGGIVYQQSVNDTRSVYGFSINNSLNFSLSKSIYVGMEAAVGLKFYDSHPNSSGQFSSGSLFSGSGTTAQTFQANFNLGYRF